MKVKDELICLLEEAHGKAINGSEVANKLGVSRNAVWKSIIKLREEGFEIESNKDGYILTNDILYPELISYYLDNENVVIDFHDEIDSTNKHAKTLIGSSDKPIIVVSKRQSAGRGRLDRKFYSEGGIYLSILVSSNMLNISPVLITTAAAKAVHKTLSNEVSNDVKIKWINDIYVDGKKVCGILSEAVSELEIGTISNYIVGIGVNVGVKNFPKDIEDIAYNIDDNNVRKNKVCANIVSSFLNAIKDTNENVVEYAKENSFVLGKEINYFKIGEEGKGKAVDIGPNGELIIDTKEKGRIALSGGEISIRVKK